MANEIRLRSNNQQGTITDNPLTDASTTINSASFVSLPTVGPTQHLILILDPLETNGAAEIVTVTAHTAAATSVTVVRGAEGSVARTHIAGTTWFHGPVESDFSYTQRTATSAIRPTSPFDGEMIYETDTDRFVSRINGVWQPAPHNVPACRVFHSVNQSIPDATSTILAFDSERYDTDSMHSTVTNNSRITFNTAGLYLVTVNVEFAAGTYDYASVAVRMNGTTFLGVSDASQSAGLFGAGRTVATVYKFAATDYVEARVFQDNGAAAARNVNVAGNYTPEFSATWIGVG